MSIWRKAWIKDFRCELVEEPTCIGVKNGKPSIREGTAIGVVAHPLQIAHEP